MSGHSRVCPVVWAQSCMGTNVVEPSVTVYQFGALRAAGLTGPSAGSSTKLPQTHGKQFEEAGGRGQVTKVGGAC